ncbi:hypothetical protein F5I97DRAFT_1928350 [Phlebopus sp. FC_14]|nr:hypothetical protein F5I97DRAFT_1928350 [Phlebopus sp. FC_14]
MVVNGVLRPNEAKKVDAMLNKDIGVDLTVAQDHRQYVHEAEAAKIEAVAEEEEKNGAEAKRRVEWLLQGTFGFEF